MSAGLILLLNLLAQEREALWPHNLVETAMVLEVEGGRRIVQCPDVNGDGREDLLAALDSQEFPFCVLYLKEFSAGKTTPADPRFQTTFFEGAPDLLVDNVGAAGVGDVDGDGYGDFLIGPFGVTAPDSPVIARSWLLLVFGGRSLPGGTFNLIERAFRSTKILSPDGFPELFLYRSGNGITNSTVSVLRGTVDFDGDGYNDILIGVRRPRGLQSENWPDWHGALYAVQGRRDWPAEGSVDALIEQHGFVVLSRDSSYAFPAALSAAGDVDGDDLGDVAITAANGDPILADLLSYCKTYVVFGGTRLPESAEGLGDAAWVLDHIFVSGSAGDVDADGYADLLASTIKREIQEKPAQGFILYGAPRPELKTLRTPQDLVPGRATSLQSPPFTSQDPRYGLTDAGATNVLPVSDLDADGFPDFVVGCPARSVFYGKTKIPRAGQIGLIRGLPGRPEELSLQLPYLEGFFQKEELGKAAFKVSFEQRETLAVSSAWHSAEKLFVSFLPLPFPAESALSLTYAFSLSPDKLLLLGSGFDDSLRVHFDGKEAAETKVFSRSVAEAAIPPGEPGLEVFLTAARSDGRVSEEPVSYKYPESRATRVLRLDRLIGKGVCKIHSTDPDLTIQSAILAGDITGDGQGEIIVACESPEGSRLLVISSETAQDPELDIKEGAHRVKSVLKLDVQEPAKVRVIDSGDFDGDGLSDLCVTIDFDTGKSAFGIVFGRTDLLQSTTLEPGSSFMVVDLSSEAERPLAAAYMPGDLNLDGSADLVCLLRRPGGAEGCLITYGGVWTRKAGRISQNELLAQVVAVFVENGLWFVPGGEFDDAWPPEIIASGSGDSSDYILAVLSPQSLESLAGEDISFNELISVLRAPAKEAGIPGLMLRGPAVMDAFGTTGFALKTVTFEPPVKPGEPPTMVGGFFFAPAFAWDSIGSVFDPTFDTTWIGSKWTFGGISRSYEVTINPAGGRRVLNYIGDFDGDGIGEFLLPVVKRGSGDMFERVLLLYGFDLFSARTRDFNVLGDRACDLAVEGLGALDIAAPAGDLNSDGYNDILLGYGSPFVPGLQYYLVMGRPERLWDSGAAGIEFFRGDVNADGKVDIADAIFVLGYLFGGGPSPSCADAADTNDDGKLNVGDAIATLQYLFSAAGPLPPPFPDCGTDPTDDELNCRSFRPCEVK